MHPEATFLALLVAILIILAAAVSCSSGAGKAGDASVPCETVVIIAAPGALIVCPQPPR